LAVAVAGITDNLLYARISARSIAVWAGLFLGDLDFGSGSKNGLVKFDREVVTKVRTSPHMTTLSTRGSENVTEPKEVSQYVAEVGKNVGIESTETTAPDTRMAEMVILSSLVRIAQDAIGFGSLFELLFGSLVTLVTIRMILNREFPIGTLYFLWSRVSSDTEDFVIISFHFSFQASSQRQTPPSLQREPQL
jgi:hypothetical protein